MLISFMTAVDHQRFIFNIFCIYYIIANSTITQFHLNTHPLVPVWSSFTVSCVFITIEKEISKAIKNRFPLVFFPALRTMGMASDHTICTKIYKITVASDDFWQWYINVFNTIMRQNKKIVNLFFSLL